MTPHTARQTAHHATGPLWVARPHSEMSSARRKETLRRDERTRCIPPPCTPVIRLRTRLSRHGGSDLRGRRATDWTGAPLPVCSDRPLRAPALGRCPRAQVEPRRPCVATRGAAGAHEPSSRRQGACTGQTSHSASSGATISNRATASDAGALFVTRAISTASAATQVDQRGGLHAAFVGAPSGIPPIRGWRTTSTARPMLPAVTLPNGEASGSVTAWRASRSP